MERDNFSNNLVLVKQWLGQGSINIFGMPFAGKDTQGAELARLLDAPLLSGGHILRNSNIPEDVQKTMDRGELVPSDEYEKIVLPYLSQKDFIDKPLVLSSVGRWHGEEAGVLQATTAAGHPLKAVIYLTIPEALAHERHAHAAEGERGNRADDAPHVLTTRFQEFRVKTLPVIQFYSDKGLLIEVDGSNDPESTTTIILAKLAQFAKRDMAR